MQQSDRPRFVECLNMMAAVYRVEPSEPWLMGYWIALATLDVFELEAAAKKAMTECEFMPTPAKLRELCGRGKRLQHFGTPPSFGPGDWRWELAEAKERALREERRQERARLGPQEPESVGELLPRLLERMEKGEGKA